MSESKNTEPHRVMGGPVHPAVTMAVLIAQQAYASGLSDMAAETFDRMLDAVCVGDD